MTNGYMKTFRYHTSRDLRTRSSHLAALTSVMEFWLLLFFALNVISVFSSHEECAQWARDGEVSYLEDILHDNFLFSV